MVDVWWRVGGMHCVAWARSSGNRYESPGLEAKVDVGRAMSRETSDQMRQSAEMGSVFDQARPMVRQEDRHLQRRHDRRSGWLRKLAIVFAVLALLAVVVLFVVVPFLHDEYGLLVGSEASALIR